MSAPEPSPDARLRQLLVGYRSTYLLSAAAELGLPDHLHAGPTGSADLAARLGLDAAALRRVLRALAQLGVVAEHADGRFALTPVGAGLCTDAPGSQRHAARFRGLAMQWHAWGNLVHSIRTGASAFDDAAGMSFWQYLAAHPAAAAVFNGCQESVSAPVATAIVAAYDFGGCGTLVDVAGGNGALLAAILQAHPQARGIVLDLPHVEADARRTMVAAGVADRFEFVAGDMFAAAPPGADAYLVKSTLHNWDDERSVAILRACRRAVPPQGRVLVIERRMPEGNEPALDVVMGDIDMLAFFGSRERSAAEYGALFEQAGFRLARVLPTQSVSWLFEGAPV